MCPDALPDLAPAPAEQLASDQLRPDQLTPDQAGPIVDLRPGTPDPVIDLRAPDRQSAPHRWAGPLADDPATQPYLSARLLTDPGQVLAARQLHAAVYVASGYLGPGDLAPDGTLHASADPWQHHCLLAGVVTGGTVTATARQLLAPGGDLPALTLNGLWPGAAGPLRRLGHGDVAEISGLARHPHAPAAAVVALYVRLWHESLRAGHHAWVMAVDTRVFSRLRATVCGHALRPIGPVQRYLGSDVVPAVLWLGDLAQAQADLAAQALPGSRGELHRLLPRLFPAPSPVRAR